MSIPVPTPGSPILDTWGAAVTSKLNRLIPLIMTADQATNSATAVNVTDLVFPVVAGRTYNIQLSGAYLVNAANQGIQMGFNCPAGSILGYHVVTGNGSATGKTENRMTTSGDLYGRTATDAAFGRNWWMDARFAAAASGTFQIIFARGGTSGAPGVTIYAGSGGLVIESA